MFNFDCDQTLDSFTNSEAPGSVYDNVNSLKGSADRGDWHLFSGDDAPLKKLF